MSYNIKHIYLDHKSIRVLPHDWENNENVYTILIGKNGTGKSRLLSGLANSLCSIRANNKLLKRDIGIVSRYLVENNKLTISLFSNYKNHTINISGRSIDLSGFDINRDGESFCPKALIAVSTSPFDKFPEEHDYFSPFKGNKNDGFYSYYGLNGFGKNKAIHSLMEKVLFSSATGTIDKDRVAVSKVLNFLGYNPRLRVIFRLRHSINTYMDNLSSFSPNEFMEYVAASAKLNLSYLKEKYNISYTKIRDAFVKLGDHAYKNDSVREFDFTIDYEKSIVSDYHSDFFDKIRVLSTIGIFSIKDIILYPIIIDENEYYGDDVYDYGISVSDASSGQQCILLNTLGIASSIKNNSLILIDEPEISLHPEWQEAYISLLMEVFESYSGCHFIIATHSPQIISNLRSKNCFITQIDNGDVISSEYYTNKSADFQLATLFAAPGSDNEYLKRIVVNLLTVLSSGKYIKDKYIEELVLLKKSKDLLDESDPVKYLIDLAIEVEGRLQ
ncbi:AAA family ATPase [Yersinia rochesterensis]|uniref:AAA family ATPase n=1 Tax=Yersinia rochesterensis TaxID=1604335 RepID=UPI0025AA399F|nr:AAA family ATPase [Yersinia rochesterensis]MDN0107095.1 AAA family ATPase [Yersinia rochesterensis]